MSTFKRVFQKLSKVGNTSKGVALEDARIDDDLRVYAVGDIHGCIEELDAMLLEINQDLKSNPVARHKVIFLGDYVDRGPDSKRVIDRMIALSKSSWDVVVLRGNHEEKLVRAASESDTEGMAGFFRHGGKETMASYGFNVTPLK